MNDFLLKKIQDVVVPATGCTEPVAIALNAATARDNLKGKIKAVRVKMDICLLKNAMGVGIPGVPERGVAMCVAVGLAGGDASRGMDVLGGITETHHQRALELLPLVEVQMDDTRTNLYVETVLESDEDTVRVITDGNHDRIVAVEHAPFEPYISQNFTDDSLESYTIEDFRKFADTVELDKLFFLKEGVEMNLAVSKAGEKLPWGKSMETLAEKGYMGDSLLLNVQRITSCASFARMSGVQLPVMTTTGSGNQGITLILTVAATAMELGVPEEKMLRAIAFAQAINLYAKHYLGTLSCLCSCSVASGLSASAGIVYMMGGSDQQVLDTMRNVLGSISGMICDGAKEGCASTVCLSTGLSVMSAMMALNGMNTKAADGILADNLKDLFTNLGNIANVGMAPANAAIVDIMLKK